MAKLFLTSGGIFALLAVLLGAFGSHGLESRLSKEMMEIFRTGVRYHFYHALGLLIVGILSYQMPNSTWLWWAGWMMVTGIIIFSGSLYILTISGMRWLGAITPIGGTAFIIGWILFILAVIRQA